MIGGKTQHTDVPAFVALADEFICTDDCAFTDLEYANWRQLGQKGMLFVTRRKTNAVYWIPGSETANQKFRSFELLSSSPAKSQSNNIEIQFGQFGKCTPKKIVCAPPMLSAHPPANGSLRLHCDKKGGGGISR
jgi:hypothetical protein